NCPATTGGDHLRRFGEQFRHRRAFERAKMRFAMGGENLGDRRAGSCDNPRIEVAPWGVQEGGGERGDRRLPCPRQPDQHDRATQAQPSSASGCCARTASQRRPAAARYPSRLRRVSVRASPPNFSSIASARTRATSASAITPIAGTAVTSERSLCAFASPPVARLTVLSGDMSVEIGFIATRTTNASPVVIPPSSPPALLPTRRKPARGSK